MSMLFFGVYQLLNIASGQLRIIKLIGSMLLLSHWNGCVQFLVPYLLEFPDNSWVVINGLKVAAINSLHKINRNITK